MCAKLDHEVFHGSGNLYALHGLSVEQACSIRNGIQDRSAGWSIDLNRGSDGHLSLLATLDTATLVVTRDVSGIQVAALTGDVFRSIACHRDTGSVIAALLPLLRQYSDDQQPAVGSDETCLVPNWG